MPINRVATDGNQGPSSRSAPAPSFSRVQVSVHHNGLPVHFHEPHLPGGRGCHCPDDVLSTNEGSAGGKQSQRPWGEQVLGSNWQSVDAVFSSRAAPLSGSNTR